jgi:hypothetical protein
MRTLHSPRVPHHRVIADFDGSSLSFPLPRDATFEDLAGRLAALGQSHHGAPIRVEVTLGAFIGCLLWRSHLGDEP